MHLTYGVPIVITLMKLLFIGAHTIVPRLQFVWSILPGCFCWRVSEADQTGHTLNNQDYLIKEKSFQYSSGYVPPSMTYLSLACWSCSCCQYQYMYVGIMLQTSPKLTNSFLKVSPLIRKVHTVNTHANYVTIQNIIYLFVLYWLFHKRHLTRILAL